MAHPCIECGGECYCHGDIDDCIVCKTPANCESCGCEEMFEDDSIIDPDDDNDYEPDFVPCSSCDGHAACEDFGCAIKLGLEHMVKKDFENL